MKKALPVIALLISMIIWSVSGIAIKHALAVLPPFTMIILRFTPAVLLMLIIGLICRGSSLFGLQGLERKDIPLFVLAGFCQPFLYYLLETFSYRALNSPTVAEALLSTSPLLAPIFAAVLLRERVTKYNILGILISSAGVFMLILMGSENFAIGNLWGVPLAFAAVSAAVMDTIIMRKIPKRYSPLSIIFYAQSVSLLFFIPIWIWREVPQLSLLTTQYSQLHSQFLVAFGSVAYLSVFSSVIAFILFCYALREVGVTQANAFNNVRPVFTALFMLLFFGEQMPLVKWFGIALIIIGLFVCQRRSFRV